MGGVLSNGVAHIAGIVSMLVNVRVGLNWAWDGHPDSNTFSTQADIELRLSRWIFIFELVFPVTNLLVLRQFQLPYHFRMQTTWEHAQLKFISDRLAPRSQRKGTIPKPVGLQEAKLSQRVASGNWNDPFWFQAVVNFHIVFPSSFWKTICPWWRSKIGFQRTSTGKWLSRRRIVSRPTDFPSYS